MRLRARFCFIHSFNESTARPLPVIEWIPIQGQSAIDGGLLPREPPQVDQRVTTSWLGPELQFQSSDPLCCRLRMALGSFQLSLNLSVLHCERWLKEVSKATGFQRLPWSGTASRRASGSHCADVYAECVTKCFIYALKHP